MLPKILLATCAAVISTAAIAQDSPIVPGDPQAQQTRYNVQEMNFDMWCQEEQHLPAARCDKRLPDDDAAFSAYRRKIERYEIPYLREQERQQQIDVGILHNDPVDHPDRPAQPTAGPAPSPVPPK